MELKLLKRRAEMLNAVSSGKATTEYAKTKGLLYVQKLLGPRSLKTTLRYTQLLVLPQNRKLAKGQPRQLCLLSTPLSEPSTQPINQPAAATTVKNKNYLVQLTLQI